MSKISYYLCEISTIVNGESFLQGDESIITELIIDSRKSTNSISALFFAIRGDRHDGHDFIHEVYSKGVRSFIISENIDLSRFPNANFVKVKNVLRALQDLATFHRKQFETPVIGLTGSNGKTIVKEWLYQLLKEDKNIVRSPKSYNSQVGVPLSVWEMSEENNLAIFEAGISQTGEMEFLQKVIAPTMGIFTNIGEAHAADFADISEKITEKLKLFKEVEILIYNKDYSLIHDEVTKEEWQRVSLFSWSRKSKANLQVGRVSKKEYETEIQAVFKNEFITIRIPFTDEASVENAITCWAAMLVLGYMNDTIAERMNNLSPVAMRLELKEGTNNCAIINDSYNSDLSSLGIAIDFLNQQKQHEKRTLVLSDILQSGRDEEGLYREVAQMITTKGITRLIGIGDSISKQSNLFTCQKAFYKSTDEFLKQFDPGFFRDETILLKGARVYGFEQISKLLQQKAHETVLEINLNALVHNLNYFKSKVSKRDNQVKLMAMVKAFSYGSGSYEIASVLQFHRVDYLTVAYADEGIELRRAGINLPIMVMNPEEQSFDAMLQFYLEPEIYSFRILNSFEAALRRRTESHERQVAIHIKLDTGMHRLGFEDQDLNELIVRIRNNKQIRIQSVFSHLAASDEAEHDSFTQSQVEKFKGMSEKICSHFDYKIYKHILNSAGIIRHPDAMFDMVRLGIGLYGVGCNAYEQDQLQNVSTLKSIISQIKIIPEGETVGYSRKGKSNKEIQIATIPIGYADGLSRKLSNGKGKMLVKGKFAPIIGNVCMDMCMIDITGIEANEGDEVIVFGDRLPISEIAEDSETIPYEILTNISRRVKRVYFQE